MDTLMAWLWWSFHNIYQNITLYTLNLYNFCQLHLAKAGRRGKLKARKKKDSLNGNSEHLILFPKEVEVINKQTKVSQAESFENKGRHQKACVLLWMTAGTPEEGAREDRTSWGTRSLGGSGALDASLHGDTEAWETLSQTPSSWASVSFTKLRSGLPLPSPGFIKSPTTLEETEKEECVPISLTVPQLFSFLQVPFHPFSLYMLICLHNHPGAYTRNWAVFSPLTWFHKHFPMLLHSYHLEWLCNIPLCWLTIV